MQLIARKSPPGRLINVDGKRTHIVLKGKGTPTVVLEGGIGTISTMWNPILDAVAEFTTVCTFDRPGYAWSDATDAPRTSRQMASELVALLEAANLPGPYVLVGHSIGGLNAKLFAAMYPKRVAGLILLDAVDESVFEISADFRSSMIAIARLFTMLGTMARTGVLPMLTRLLGTRAAPPYVAKLSTHDRAEVLAQYSAKTFATSRAEAVSLVEHKRELPHAEHFGDLPVAIIARDEIVSRDERGRQGERAWRAAQIAQQSLSTRSSFVVLGQCGHDVPVDAPRLVVHSIRAMLNALPRAAGT